jgi:hypothetical protein
LTKLSGIDIFNLRTRYAFIFVYAVYLNNWIVRGRFKTSEVNVNFSESLILAQDKRWRRALRMQVERF